MEWFINGLSSFGGALFGAAIGIAADRAWKKVESIPRFRVHAGFSYGVLADGVTLSVENVGAVDIPSYDVWLVSPGIGSYKADWEDKKNVFPQFPNQKNNFIWYTKVTKDPSSQKQMQEWFHRTPDGRSEVPLLDGSKLQIKPTNSDWVLFSSTVVGEYLAYRIYDAVTGNQRNPPKGYFYASNALWWDEWFHCRRQQKIIDAVSDRARAKQATAEKDTDETNAA